MAVVERGEERRVRWVGGVVCIPPFLHFQDMGRGVIVVT